MRISTLIIVVVLTFFMSKEGFAQKNKRLQRAYETFNAGEYYDAIDIFKDAYQKITDKNAKAKITYYIAQCYRLIDQPREASMWYDKVIHKTYYQNPTAVLYYADMLRKLGEYDEAREQYKNYQKLVPDDKRATDGLLSCDLAQKWMKSPNGYVVEEMKFFNSRMSDYSPAYASKDYRQVYFTSTRQESSGKKIHGATGQGFADIYTSTMDRKGKWSTPVPISQNINTDASEGTPYLTRDYNTMYFTRCEESSHKTMGCQIYVSKRQGNDWGKPKKLDIAPDSDVVAHPALSPDELTLYFVSDMPGSMKRPDGSYSKDIWKVTRKSVNDKWGKPVNLGAPINTPGDEVFPYVHADGTLYFSSNGRPGMGGLDVYEAKPGPGGTWDIKDMQYPFNSSADDFGVCFEDDREAGFLSSSRKGRGNDDIYEFMLPPLRFSITGVVKNDKTEDPIADATIRSISSTGITMQSKTDDKGTFKFMLNPATDYVFLASKKGFLNGKDRETTKGKETSTDFTTTIYLSPTNQAIRIDNIYFDFGRADLRPESTVALDKLVETLNDNPNIVIELGAHTDSRGNHKFNMQLSLDRARSVINYLISKGIDPDRLVAKGYGETQPKVVDKKDHENYPFLPVGQVLSVKYINSLKNDDLKEIAYSLNRRTEFKVLREDYVPKKKPANGTNLENIVTPADSTSH